MLVGLFGVGKAYIDHSNIDRVPLSDAIARCDKWGKLSNEELYSALRNAHAAGDTAAAQKLADYIRSLPVDAGPWNDYKKAESGGYGKDPEALVGSSSKYIITDAPSCAGRDAAQLTINSQEYKIDNERGTYLFTAFVIFLLGSIPIAIRYSWYFLLKRLAELADAIRGQR